MTTYVTFGHIHKHFINGHTLDRNCVAVLKSNSQEEGRRKAFELFGNQFCFEYYEDQFEQGQLAYFPKGLVHI